MSVAIDGDCDWEPGTGETEGKGMTSSGLEVVVLSAGKGATMGVDAAIDPLFSVKDAGTSFLGKGGSSCGGNFVNVFDDASSEEIGAIVPSLGLDGGGGIKILARVFGEGGLLGSPEALGILSLPSD